MAREVAAFDDSGFPLASEVRLGNISEPSDLADALRRSRAFADEAQLAVIMDAGRSTESAVDRLRWQGYDRTTALRAPQGSPRRTPDSVFEIRQGRARSAARISSTKGSLGP